MRCVDARAAFLAGDPASEEHMASCASCRAGLGHLVELRDVLSSLSTWVEPDPRGGDRLVAALTAESDSPGTDRRSSPRPLTWAAAAVLVIAGLAGGLVLRPPPPDWEVDVRGTDFAPQAAGTVRGWTSESGSKLVVDVDGLDPAPPGTVYELWLSSADRHVSAGTFTALDGVELWVGVPRREYPRIWVTIEPLDTDPAPSGKTVLDTPSWMERTGG